MADDQSINLGTNSDLVIVYNSAGDFGRINNTSGHLYIQNSADDRDIIFRSDDGSGGLATYFQLDGSLLRTSVFKDMRFNDDVVLQIGTSSDLRLYHDATNSTIDNRTGDLILEQNQDDGDIIFKAENGSGGITEYFRLDGSTEQNVVSKNMRFEDNIQAQFGAGTDLRIYHDGSNSYINESGTGSLIIQSSDLFLRTNSTENAIVCAANASVTLYHNNVAKLATTSTGITVTGEIGIGGATIIDTTATYTQIRNPESTRCIFLGDSGDPSNYYDNTLHIFRSAAGAANYLTINSSLATFEDDVRIKGDLTVDGDIIHGGGNSGTFTGSKSFTGGAASVILFRLFRPTTGALVFDVYLTSGTSGYACKKYTVAHRFNTAPNYNKIIDSGAATNGDYVVTFANNGQSVGGDSISCSIAATTTQDIYYTIQVGQGASGVTRYTS
jgi:hypothetical protein